MAGIPEPREQAAPLFSVVVPTRGEPQKLLSLLRRIEGQSLARDRFEIIVAFDGVEPDSRVTASLDSMRGRAVPLARRAGPGAARNAGAAVARGEYLAFTEDDCSPEPDWLERAAARLAAQPALDAIEGATLKPGGRPVRTMAAGGRLYLPTNLFVRRERFARLGGYYEGFFDPANGAYFREDSDFGFTLEEAGARIESAPEVKVTHPDEHPGWLDPLRWARRYEMDALLASRHPRLFRERIEVHRLGPVTIRRPIVRAASAYVLALIAATASAAFGHDGLAATFLLIAFIAFLPIWAKWGLALWRLPVALLVPFALLAALVRGGRRVRGVAAASSPDTKSSSS